MKQRIKVLILDDDVFTLRIQDKLLTRMGYEVFTCNTAVNIFDSLEKYTPDIILMDYEMPLITGMEAIKQLKANELSKAIPIIFFSLYDNLAEEAINAGAALYVPKGSTPGSLAAAINKLVNNTAKAGITTSESNP